MTLRIVFMGTPDFSVPTLEALHNAGHEIVACYTQPPRPAGRRGLDLVPSPVQQAAEKLEIPVYHPTSLKGDDEQKIFQSHRADVAVVVAYGLLLPKPVLNAPKQGCYNGHASLLPRWRGAAPLQRAIMAGDAETGMMIMKMEEGLDTGPIALQSSVPITELTTAASLHDQLSEVGADLMVQAMDRLAAGDLPLSAQSGDGILYASKIQKAESRINWDQSCEVVHRHVMGLSPFPGAWCEMPIAGKVVRVKVLESKVQRSASAAPGTLLNDSLTIACKTGGIELVRLQKAGSKATTAEEFLRGNQLVSGEVLE